MNAEAMIENAGEDERPIIFEELAFLPSLGISGDSISFTAISMESDKRICVQEQPPIPGRTTGSIAIIDVPTASLRGRFPSGADSAIINPKLSLLALLANKKIEIYDMDKKARVTQCESPETVVYWRWVSTTMIAFVTKSAIFHWPAVHKNGAPAAPQPYKFFDRHVGMKGMQMINYRTTSVPDPSNPQRTMPVGCLVGIAKEGERIAGRMQLFASEKNTTQTLEGHACSFVRWGKNNTRRLFCYATRTPSESMFHVYELSPPKDEKAFKRKSTPIYFPPEAAADFPVAMQVSDKHKVAYIITKYGYLHIFDIHSAELIYMNRISADTVFTTVPASHGSPTAHRPPRGEQDSALLLPMAAFLGLASYNKVMGGLGYIPAVLHAALGHFGITGRKELIASIAAHLAKAANSKWQHRCKDMVASDEWTTDEAAAARLVSAGIG